jgi:hypothetical protein
MMRNYYIQIPIMSKGEDIMTTTFKNSWPYIKMETYKYLMKKRELRYRTKAKKVFNEIIAENFQNLGKNMDKYMMH